MVNTKSEVKIKLKEWTEQQNIPFRTKEAMTFIRSLNPKSIRLSPHRVANYLRQTKKVQFDKINKQWFPAVPVTNN